MNRCEAVYHNCDEIYYNEVMGISDEEASKINGNPNTEKLPYVTRKCPDNYKRLGCCKCARSCSDYPNIFKPLSDRKLDNHDFCIKRDGIVSSIQDDYVEHWEPVADKFIEPCKDGWQRVG